MNTMTLIGVALAGWINRQQQDVIEYLREEVRVLKELQGGEVNCRERLGGLLRYYYQEAA